jgi:hypothetical protein
VIKIGLEPVTPTVRNFLTVIKMRIEHVTPIFKKILKLEQYDERTRHTDC